MESYTLDQVKAAFWANFHGVGEVWFSYDNPNGPDEEECTQEHWNEFVEALKGKQL